MRLVAGKGRSEVAIRYAPKQPSEVGALQVVRSQCPPGRCIDEPSKSCWKTSLKIVGMKVIVQVEMNVHVNVEFIATNVRPIRSEDFEQSIRQCAWLHRDVFLVKRDCRNSIAINSAALEAGSKRASSTWNCVVTVIVLGWRRHVQR